MEPLPPPRGRAATTGPLSGCCVVPHGHKKGPTSVEPQRPREVATTNYVVVDSNVRMICVSSSCSGRALDNVHSRPREYLLYRPRAASRKCFVGSGAEGIRTPDLRRAKAALSQLSYGPARRRVGQPGIEPGTSVLSGLRSSRLSYWPATDASSLPDARPRRHLKQEESGAEGASGRGVPGRARWRGGVGDPAWDRPGDRPWRPAGGPGPTAEPRRPSLERR